MKCCREKESSQALWEGRRQPQARRRRILEKEQARRTKMIVSRTIPRTDQSISSLIRLRCNDLKNVSMLLCLSVRPGCVLAICLLGVSVLLSLWVRTMSSQNYVMLVIMFVLMTKCYLCHPGLVICLPAYVFLLLFCDGSKLQ